MNLSALVLAISHMGLFSRRRKEGLPSSGRGEEAFIRCPACNKVLHSTIARCPYCAAFLEVKCPNCDRTTNRALKQCPFCEASLQD